jgi:GMP synthase-like glutamine amidotransferase
VYRYSPRQPPYGGLVLATASPVWIPLGLFSPGEWVRVPRYRVSKPLWNEWPGPGIRHQALGQVHGAKVTKAPVPMHGRLHTLKHNDHAMFEGIPSGAGARDLDGNEFKVVRYHSLVVEALPACLEATAWTDAAGGRALCLTPYVVRPSSAQHKPPLLWFACKVTQLSHLDTSMMLKLHTTERLVTSKTHLRERELVFSMAFAAGDGGGGMDDAVIMAMRHVDRPHWGVQFHPESICTEFGEALYRNFVQLAADHWKTKEAGEAPDEAERIAEGVRQGQASRSRFSSTWQFVYSVPVCHTHVPHPPPWPGHSILHQLSCQPSTFLFCS